MSLYYRRLSNLFNRGIEKLEEDKKRLIDTVDMLKEGWTPIDLFYFSKEERNCEFDEQNDETNYS